jgi:hypothetical protein
MFKSRRGDILSNTWGDESFKQFSYFHKCTVFIMGGIITEMQDCFSGSISCA